MSADPSYHRRFISVRNAAELLGVHPMTIYGWIAEKKIPAIRIGRRFLRVDATKLDLILDGQLNGKRGAK